LPYVLNDEVGDDLAAGRRHPEWLWLALRGDRVVARAGWWSPAGDQYPLLMDIFDVDGDTDDGVRLLKTALPAVVPAGATPPEFVRFLPADWRDQQQIRQAVGDRMGALERVGARLFVERLRLEWRPGTPVAELSGRLIFRPVRDPVELIELMALVLDGTLDAHSRDDLTRMTPIQAAQEQYHNELERYASPHEWWRIATLPDGEPVGFVIPAHNGYNPIIAYLGVVPAHRGHGYVRDLLAAGTSLLAAQNVPRIRAATDVGNAPMATAFALAGYVTFERQIDMTWRVDTPVAG
jgi:RimJ/RimL family protein N-acetyltransferase